MNMLPGLPMTPAVTIETQRVFTPGQLCYLQAARNHSAALALAEIYRPLANNLIELHWLAGSALDHSGLQSGMTVRLSTGEKRILFVVEGTVAQVLPGDPGGVAVTVPAECAGFNRRRHPRYELLAQIQIFPTGESSSVAPSEQVPVDLSLGGFGLRVPDPGWPVGVSVRYQLDMAPVQTASGLNVAPGLRLQGQAILRRRVDQADGLMLLGFEFADMSGYRENVLQFWLDTFNVYLRER